MSNLATAKANEVMLFQRAADLAHDAELKGWATKNLPTLKQHQESAMAINKKIATN